MARLKPSSSSGASGSNSINTASGNPSGNPIGNQGGRDRPSTSPQLGSGVTKSSHNSRSRKRSSSSEPSQTRSRSRSRSRAASGSISRSRSSTTSSFLAYVSHGSYGSMGRSLSSKKRDRIFSLFRLLKLELNLPPADKSDGVHRPSAVDDADVSFEQVFNLVKVPFFLEKFMVFGILVCLNSFLTLFTLVPLKICIMSYRSVCGAIAAYKTSSRFSWGSVAQEFTHVKRDLITVSLIVSSVFILSSPNLDISRMYHDVRGQAHIKLYVMFGVLEVADKLCSSIGQDILNILYGVPLTASSGSWGSHKHDYVKFSIFYILALAYLAFHSYICIYQTVSLNVAANSYSNALLTLLLSNQFAELKSSVFKKFEREGLFQITMADLTERFQLTLMLGIIALRNLLQLNTIHLGLIPDSWKSWNKWIGALFGPSIVVLGSEMLVDWLKHCYISKFNRVRPHIYRNFLYVISLDYLEVFKSTSNANSSHELTDYIVLTKRIGLPLLAYIVCFLRMTLPDLKNFFLYPNSSIVYSIVISFGLVFITLSTLLFIRLILGLILLRWANRIKHSHQTYQAHLRAQQQKSPLTLPPNPTPISLSQSLSQSEQAPSRLTTHISSPILAGTTSKPKSQSVDEIGERPSSFGDIFTKPRTTTETTTNSRESLSKQSVSASPKTSCTKSPSFSTYTIPLVDLNLPSRTPSPIDPLFVNGNNTSLEESAIAEEENQSPLVDDKTASGSNDTIDHNDSSLSSSFVERSAIESSFLPGIPNTEPSSINPTTRSYLYDYGEKIPLTTEERRNKQILKTQGGGQSRQSGSDDEGLSKVNRYEMASKRIW